MKLKAFIFCLMMPLLALAQHLDFRGIPIEGSIYTFGQKLVEKGYEPDWMVSDVDEGGKSLFFDGTYFNHKCTLLASCIPSTKEVYSVMVFIEEPKLSATKKLVTDIKNALEKKYGWEFGIDSGEENQPAYEAFVDAPAPSYASIGLVSVGYYYDSDNEKYNVTIYFYDFENGEKFSRYSW